MKAWYCVCILIFLYTLNILIEEGVEVTYVSSDKPEEDPVPVSYLSCFSLKMIYPNDSEVRLERMQLDLYLYFSKFEGSWKRKDWGKVYLKMYEELVLKRISSRNYIIWADLLCLIQDDKEQILRIFPFFRRRLIWLANNNRTFDRIDLKYNFFGLNQMIVINRGYPYTNCLNGRHQSRFHCLNECLKKRKRLSKYFYGSHETGPIFLNQQDEDESTIKSEQECSNQCYKDSCKLIYYFLDWKALTTDVKPKIFEAIPLIPRFEFIFQLVGLLCLTLNCCFKQALYLLIKLSSKTQREGIVFFRKTKLFWFFNSMLLLATLATFAYLNSKMIMDYEAKKSNPIKKETTVNLVKLEQLRVVICFSVSKGAIYFENTTALEIEKDTNNELENLDQIFLEFQDKQTNVNYFVKPLTAFKGFRRCFQLELDPEEPRYRSLLAVSKLVIKFKEPSKPIIYLLTNNETFSSGSFWYVGVNNVIKKVTKRVSGCKEYKQVHPECVSREW